MAHIVILGGGAAGTMMANRLRRRFAVEIDAGVTDVTVVDLDDRHLYQPGLLFVPFGIYRPDDIVHSRRAQLHPDVRFTLGAVQQLHPAERMVELADGTRMPYDVCIVASGSVVAPEETEGLTGPGWGRRIFNLYTLDGAVALARALEAFQGGRLVINVVDTPIRHPSAPLEFAFLADWYFTMRGSRGDVEITYVTPLDEPFAEPACTRRFGHLLQDKGVNLVPAFRAAHVDGVHGLLSSWDDQAVRFDLLVTVPLHLGAACVRRTPGLGDEAGFVLTDPHTLQSRLDAAIFSLGDAANVPITRSVAATYFEGAVLEGNVARFLDGLALEPGFDGHTSCFVETGFEKALLLDFNYDTEPLRGKFPLASLGPMSLLEESRVNHMGRMACKWLYWNVLLPGRDIPGVGPRLSMRGKQGAGVSS